MGGQIIAVLGLLSLVSGALLTGEDQEQTTSQSNDLLNESSVATTSASFVNSDFQDVSVSSKLSEFVEATSGSQGTEKTLKTERPASEVLSTATEQESATVTGVQEEVTTESDRAVSSPRRTFPIPDTSDAVTSADLTPPTPTSHPAATTAVEEGTTETSDNETERPSLVSTLRTSAAQTQTSMESTVDTTEPATSTTAFHHTWMSVITTSLFITTTVTSADPTSPATQSTTTSRTTRAEVQKGSSVLEVGDDKELPSYHSITRSNPLFVMIVSIFTVMVVMIVVVVGFHRYKKRSSRTEFRRLQDLPMDDMMEDTPLSLYSY